VESSSQGALIKIDRRLQRTAGVTEQYTSSHLYFSGLFITKRGDAQNVDMGFHLVDIFKQHLQLVGNSHAVHQVAGKVKNL